MPDRRDEHTEAEQPLTRQAAEHGQEHPGLEGAAGEDAGLLRRAPVEGGDELSIGGSPPSAAGGTRNSPAPTRDDLQR